MNLTSVKTIKALCKKYNFWPSRKSGQNFLISQDVLEKIIQAANLNSQDLVLEIGAGFGTLTFALTLRVKKVIAVELDKRLAKALRDLLNVQNVQDVQNVKIVEGDIFELRTKNQELGTVNGEPRTMNQELGTLNDLGYKLVSNLPYNITSLVLRNFLEEKPRPSEMILLVQKEVAERVVAKPGEMSLLSVACQFYSQPEIVGYVTKENFWPQPEVDSAILKIQGVSHSTLKLRRVKLEGIDVKKFFSLVKIGFSARRKQLKNNLSAGLRLDRGKIEECLHKIGLDLKIRAQDLSVDDWVRLTRLFN